MISASPRPVKPRPMRRLAIASSRCCGERPGGDVEHVVEHAHRDLRRPRRTRRSRTRASGSNGVAHEAREIDRAEAAAAVRRQRLLGAGIGRLDRLAVVEVVVAVDAVEEQDARLGVVVRRAHDLVPQLARARPCGRPTGRRRAGTRRRLARPAPARRWCTSSTSPSASTARMNASVTPTEMLKLVRSPSSLAWMNSSMSGWSQRSTPICAPRRAPADSTVSQRAVEHAHVATPARWRATACR